MVEINFAQYGNERISVGAKWNDFAYRVVIVKLPPPAKRFCCETSATSRKFILAVELGFASQPTLVGPRSNIQARSFSLFSRVYALVIVCTPSHPEWQLRFQFGFFAEVSRGFLQAFRRNDPESPLNNATTTGEQNHEDCGNFHRASHS